MKPVVVHSEARVELDDAMAFYESRACGLGLDFQTKVERAIFEEQGTGNLFRVTGGGKGHGDHVTGYGDAGFLS